MWKVQIFYVNICHKNVTGAVDGHMPTLNMIDGNSGPLSFQLTLSTSLPLCPLAVRNYKRRDPVIHTTHTQCLKFVVLVVWVRACMCIGTYHNTNAFCYILFVPTFSSCNAFVTETSKSIFPLTLTNTPTLFCPLCNRVYVWGHTLC